MDLIFNVNGQVIKPNKKYEIYSDMKNYLTAVFRFSDDWDGLEKTALFISADGTVYKMLLVNDECTVPWEVIDTPSFGISVYGGDLLTANLYLMTVHESGYTDAGVDPAEPTPDIYNQLVETVQAERNLALAAADLANTKAALADEKAIAANTAAGAANTAAENAQDIADTVQQKLDNGDFIGPQGEKGDPGEVTLEQLNTALADKADKSALTETNLRIATINKSLSDYRNAIASINVNQSPKQTVSGFGTVTLPVNAAQGHIDVVVKGNTVSQLANNGTNYGNWAKSDDASLGADGITFTSVSAGHYNAYLQNTYMNLKPSTQYTLILFVESSDATGNGLISSFAATVASSDVNISMAAGIQKAVFTTKASLAGAAILYLSLEYSYLQSGEVRFKVNILEGDWTGKDIPFSTPLEVGTYHANSAMRIVSKSADESEQTEMYIPDVGVLRSVGDVRDEIVGGEHIKRIDDDGETVLAEPIVTPVNVTGTLVGHPNGTIYWEPVLPVAGVYTAEGISVTDTDFPIDTLERIAKIDFMTGVETEVDVSQAVIAGDGLSFTHPDLIDGDIVFFTYYHDVEGTQPEITAEYYDSRYVLKDSVTGKFYKVVESVANATLTRTLVEV